MDTSLKWCNFKCRIFQSWLLTARIIDQEKTSRINNCLPGITILITFRRNINERHLIVSSFSKYHFRVCSHQDIYFIRISPLLPYVHDWQSHHRHLFKDVSKARPLFLTPPLLRTPLQARNLFHFSNSTSTLNSVTRPGDKISKQYIAP